MGTYNLIVEKFFNFRNAMNKKRKIAKRKHGKAKGKQIKIGNR